MNIQWEFVADCLRQELADYGGLLRLFEAQQRSLFEHQPAAVLQFSSEIEVQTKQVACCRVRREEAVVALARQLGQPAKSTLRALLPLIAEEARPLLEALIHEVNTLLFRVRRTSRHNHTLLSRVVELHQESLQHLVRHPFTKTYSPAGRVTMSAGSHSSTLRAAG